MRIAKGKSLTMSGNACALAMEQFGEEDFRLVFYYSIFPNMLLSLHPDYVMVHQLFPQSPERTLIFCDWFFNPEAFKRNDFDPDDAVEFWDMVNRQDWHVCELSQQGISSSAYEPGQRSRAVWNRKRRLSRSAPWTWLFPPEPRRRICHRDPYWSTLDLPSKQNFPAAL